MINSISLEKDRYEKLMPIIAGTDMKVIALCMSDEGIPQTVDDRMKIADKLINGLPARKFMNQTFMVMATAKGLDGAIMNPLDQKMMAHILAAEALAGRDNFCMEYLKAYRAGMFEA